MAVGSYASAPVFTITVGTAGIYTNDSSHDVSAGINSEIASAPAGDAIVIDFEPGIYGESGPILLPSNTSVVGDDSTLEFLPDDPGNGALIANKDAYTSGIFTTVTTTAGTVSTLQIWSGDYTSDTQTMSASDDIIDSNISVRGMTFDVGVNHGFGSWFTNAQNIDVQNNTYINGVDGNAFVDVTNSVAAQNIAVGEINGAYDNWNGPVNISIDDNSAYMSATPTSGWSVLINSTPSGNPNNPGDAINDSIVGNQFASGYANSLAIDANALTSYGPTTESYITVQDNIDSMLGIAGQAEVYTQSPTFDILVEQNIISGLVQSAAGNGYLAAIGVYPNGAADTAEGTAILGNLIEGANLQSGQALIQNFGYSPTTENDAALGASRAAGAYPNGSGLNGTMTMFGNITNYDGQTVGGAVPPSLALNAPGALLAAAGAAEQVPGLSIADSTPSDVLSVTVMAHFGTLLIPDSQSGITAEASGGEYGLVLTGPVTQINQDLAALTFTSNAQGWDDSIGVMVTSEAGQTAVSFIPVTVETTLASYGSPLTLSSAYLSANGLGYMTNFGTLDGANLTGAAVIAEAGNNTIVMGNSISLAFLGNGNNVVDGGTDNEYITTGAGSASIQLLQGGDATVAGGTGALTVNAASGNNLIEAGTGVATILSGAGSNTITGNTGVLNVIGGSGALTIETLPQGTGTLNARLGSGNADIFALSGTATVVTQSATSNLIVTGIGNTTIQSGGNDLIDLGAGDVSLNAMAGANDTIAGDLYGSASVTMAGGDSLTLYGIMLPSDTIDFNGSGDVLTIKDPSAFSGNYITLLNGEPSLIGMTAGDTIALDGFTAITETFLSGVGLVLGDQVSDEITLGLTGSLISSQFSIVNTGFGSEISINPVGMVGPMMLSASDTLIQGTVTGSAPSYGGFFATVYGPGATNYNVVVSGVVATAGDSRADTGILLGGPGEVSNHGLIRAGTGIVVVGFDGDSYIHNTGMIQASQGNGVLVYGTAGVSNSASIIAGAVGIGLGAGGLLVNTGVVYGDVGATLASDHGVAVVDNFGKICGTLGNGVFVAGNLINQSSGTITGTQDGLYLHAQGAVASNYGYVSGLQGGVILGAGGILGNGGEIIASGGTAVQSNAGLRLVNTGLISAKTVAVQSSGAAYVLNTFKIIAGGDAISLTSAATALNFGLIESRYATGLALSQGGLLGNGGTIAAADGNAIIAGAGLVLVNTGIISADATGVQISGGANILNTHDIVTGSDAITATGYASLYNLGFIESRNSAAVVFVDGGQVGNGGAIDAASVGIDSGADLRFINTGGIFATMAGVQAAGAAYIYNSSNIIAGNDGISLAGAASIYNLGLIESDNAAAIAAAGGDIFNNGFIEGSIGISLSAAGTIINTALGRIIGTCAIAMYGASKLTNDGLITGGLTTAAGSYLDNSGTIIATPSVGLSLDGSIFGVGTIMLSVGQEDIGGKVDAGQFIDFSATNEILNLRNPASFCATLENFNPSDTINLSGISLASITNDTFNAGVLTLTENVGSIVLTFANPVGYAGETFALFADGPGTSINLKSISKMSFLASTPIAPETSLTADVKFSSSNPIVFPSYSSLTAPGPSILLWPSSNSSIAPVLTLHA
jgi:hypothetical protein